MVQLSHPIAGLGWKVRSLCWVVVLVRVTIAVIGQMQVWIERVYVAYISSSSAITDGSWGRNSNREGTWRQELMQRP